MQLIQIGVGHWLIESWSHPGEYHAVDLDMGCSCRGYQCKRNCWHWKFIKEVDRVEPSCSPDMSSEPL